MRKSLLSFGLAMTAVLGMQAANQFGCTPAEGTINCALTETNDKSALATLSLNCTATVNRDATGYITLSRGNEVMMSIPASNTRRIRCTEGYDIVETGTPEITFYTSQSNPTQMTGDYTITIPSNFFLVNGKGNDPLVYKFNVVGFDANVSFSPASGTSVEDFDRVEVTFEGASNFKINKVGDSFSTTGIYLTNMDEAVQATDENGEPMFKEVEDENGKITLEPVYLPTCYDYESVKFEGDKVIFKFPSDLRNGNYNLTINAGTISFTAANGKAGAVTFESLTYIKSVKTTGGFTLSLTGDTLDNPMKAFNYTVNENNSYGYIWYTYYSDYFTLAFPEGASTYNASGNYTEFQRLDSNGNLTSTGYYFSWRPNENKDALIAYLKEKDATEMVLSPGTYYLVIPAGTFRYRATADATPVNNDELRFGPFTVEATEEINYTITPDPAETLSGLQTIVIDFGDATPVLNPTEWLQITRGSIVYDFRGVVNGHKVEIALPNEITTTGLWTLDIQGKALSVNGIQTDIHADFTIVRDVITDVTVYANGTAVEPTLVVNDPEYDTCWRGTISTAGLEFESTSLEFIIPAGYNSLMYFLNDEVGEAKLRGIPAASLEAAGFKKAENNIIPDLGLGEHVISFTYGNDDDDYLTPTLLVLTVEPGTTGVAEIEASEADAEYYTVDGLKVVNPEKGLYIKVANGKATKVIL